jgi:NAD(P)-dependent dehydrogenase (short-subunit alcohol dehydrogenase family)
LRNCSVLKDCANILERFSVKGKTALVTGSSRGPDAAIAPALADAEANVALHGYGATPKDAPNAKSLSSPRGFFYL